MAVNTNGQSDTGNGGSLTRLDAGGDSPSGPASVLDATSYAEGIRGAFMLGWSITELKGRVRVAPLSLSDATGGAAEEIKSTVEVSPSTRSADLASLESSITGAFWLASSWRLHFDRISLLQRSLFPKSTTLNTYYDPGSGRPPYLYPGDPIDYANIGISATDPDGNPILEAFVLHGAARRAMNCLTLLYLNSKASLVPDVLCDQQNRLVKTIFDSIGKTISPPLQAGPDLGDLGQPIGPASQDLRIAIDIVTAQTLLFLEVWGTYLRESFYTAGITAQDETKLIAYEAGRAMAALSWEITIHGVPLEDEDSSVADSGVRDAQMRALWQRAFDNRGVSLLQHQVSVLGQALDKEYYARFGDRRQTNRAEPSPPNPSLPSQVLDAVKHSLDYWQRAAQWLAVEVNAPEGGMTASHWRSLRLALLEQTENWQALVLGQQDLRTYTAENVVRQILEDAMVTFESVATEQGLVNTSAEVVQQVTAEVVRASQQIADAVNQLGTVATREIVGFSRRLWPILLVIGAIGVVGIALVIARLTLGPASSFPDPTSLFVTIAAGLGLVHLRQQQGESTAAIQSQSNDTQGKLGDSINSVKSAATPAQTANGSSSAGGSFSDRISGIFGQEASAVMKAFDAGYKQIQTDLAGLSYAVAVTYPLVEYFVLDVTYKSINADYDFMTQIIWDQTDRKEEVHRVAFAAFGPLGLLALAKARGTDRFERQT